MLHLPFTCSKSVKKHYNMLNIFKVNNKDTRMMPGASIFNFEHILVFLKLFMCLNTNK